MTRLLADNDSYCLHTDPYVFTLYKSETRGVSGYCPHAIAELVLSRWLASPHMPVSLYGTNQII